MINGGSESRFWNDVIQMYSTLTSKYHLSNDKIYLLNYDGKNPDAENPGNIIDYSATFENLEAVFNNLENQINQDDIIIVWIDDHGDGYFGNGSNISNYVKSYYGYLGGRASIDIDDEKDYLEKDFKLRALTSGAYISGNNDHGLGVWNVNKKYTSYPLSGYRYYRTKFLSKFENIKVNKTFVSDKDMFIEELVDYLEGDLNKDSIIGAEEVEDFDGDGIPPYNPLTREYDEDDWGEIDFLEDNFNNINSRLPGETYNTGYYCIFDSEFDNKLDIDIDCICDTFSVRDGTCNESFLQVDGTDLDNRGLFDGIDVNEDGDMNDWVSIDERVVLYGGNLWDDDLKSLLSPFNVKNIFIFMQPCFSGGFINDLNRTNTLIMTATVEEDVSWGNIFFSNIREALENTSLADINKDSLVSMGEIFNFASQHDPIEFPQYEDNGDGISHGGILPYGGDGDKGLNLFIYDQLRSPYFSRIAYYPLDSNYLDYSGKENNGINNKGIIKTGIRENGVLLNDSAYIKVNNLDSLNPTKELSIALWVNPLSATDWERLVSKFYWNSASDNGGSYHTDIDSTNKKVRMMINVPSGWKTLSSRKNITMNAWTHLAFTYNGTVMRIYINGILDNEIVATGNLVQSNLPLGIGVNFMQDGSAGLNRFKGMIDEVMIWNRSLKDSEVLILAKGSINITSVPTGSEIYMYNATLKRYVVMPSGFRYTPKIIPNLTAGEYSFLLQQKNCRGRYVNVSVNNGEMKNVNVALDCVGSINVTTIPSGAMIYINKTGRNEQVGYAPRIISNLTARNYTLLAIKNNCKGKYFNINVQPGMTANAKVTLDCAIGATGKVIEAYESGRGVISRVWERVKNLF